MNRLVGTSNEKSTERILQTPKSYQGHSTRTNHGQVCKDEVNYTDSNLQLKGNNEKETLKVGQGVWQEKQTNSYC